MNEDREVEIVTKVKLSELLKSKDSDKVGGFPVGLVFFAIIFCLFSLVVISQQGDRQSPSQNNTVIVK